MCFWRDVSWRRPTQFLHRPEEDPQLLTAWPHGGGLEVDALQETVLFSRTAPERHPPLAVQGFVSLPSSSFLLHERFLSMKFSAAEAGAWKRSVIRGLVIAAGCRLAPAAALRGQAARCHVGVSASLSEVRLKLRRRADAPPQTACTPAGRGVKTLLVTINEARTYALHSRKLRTASDSATNWCSGSLRSKV